MGVEMEQALRADLAEMNSRAMEAIEEAEVLREALTLLVDACGHCLAGGYPPNEQMIDNARRVLAPERCLRCDGRGWFTVDLPGRTGRRNCPDCAL